MPAPQKIANSSETMPQPLRAVDTPVTGSPRGAKQPNRNSASNANRNAHAPRNTSRGRMPQPSTMSTFEMNFSAAASSTKPSETFSVFIHSPLFGSFLTRPGSRASSTNGAAIVRPNTPMPSATCARPAVATDASSEPTIGAVHVNEVTTSVAPIRNTPTRPPVRPALPAMRFTNCGGCSTIHPNSVSANSTNAPPITRLVSQCAANTVITSPTATPITTKINTMPNPYASASGSTEPCRASACFVKKLNVIGIIGYVHGIASAMRSEEHTSELQSLRHLVCRLLL